ncbi:MAG: response regulator transcription factor [Melioribacteraceae bacterium]|nr:response regulator transcription factor [Melioribacteraceae bacterium]
MEQISILLAEDQAVIRMALVHYFNSFSHLTVIAEASNGFEMIQKYNVHNPDVVLCDIEMPRLDGLEAATKILKERNDAKIIIMTGYHRRFMESDLAGIGIKGFVDKCASLNELKFVLEQIAKGSSFIKTNNRMLRANYFIEDKNAPNYDNHRLTNREMEILEQIGVGKTSQEIADFLFISKRTVDYHRTQIIQKLNLRSSCQLIIYATNYLKKKA